MKYIKDNKKILIILLIITLLIGGLIYFFRLDNRDNEDITYIETTTKLVEETKANNYVDVKGSVKKPGVYEFKENDRVIDAIKLAGGLTKNADTSNINLSKKLKSEMVIVINTKSELKNNNNLTCDAVCTREVIEVNNCIETENKTNNKININTADINKLTELDGIGESKAKTIIEYRTTNGLFKNIEDIKNISGIGESLYNKIKDKITV